MLPLRRSARSRFFLLFRCSSLFRCPVDCVPCHDPPLTGQVKCTVRFPEGPEVLSPPRCELRGETRPRDTLSLIVRGPSQPCQAILPSGTRSFPSRIYAQKHVTSLDTHFLCPVADGRRNFRVPEKEQNRPAFHRKCFCNKHLFY